MTTHYLKQELARRAKKCEKAIRCFYFDLGCNHIDEEALSELEELINQALPKDGEKRTIYDLEKDEEISDKIWEFVKRKCDFIDLDFATEKEYEEDTIRETRQNLHRRSTKTYRYFRKQLCEQSTGIHHRP